MNGYAPDGAGVPLTICQFAPSSRGAPALRVAAPAGATSASVAATTRTADSLVRMVAALPRPAPPARHATVPLLGDPGGWAAFEERSHPLLTLGRDAQIRNHRGRRGGHRIQRA